MVSSLRVSSTGKRRKQMIEKLEGQQMSDKSLELMQENQRRY